MSIQIFIALLAAVVPVSLLIGYFLRKVVLGHRNLRIVSDERSADVVLAVTNARFDLGNLQLALSGGKLTGRATAVCRVVNVRTGRAYVTDLVMTLRDGEVRASLVGRRFWEFWKPRPSL